MMQIAESRAFAFWNPALHHFIVTIPIFTKRQDINLMNEKDSIINNS